MISLVLSRLIILVAGVVYPAYSSYKSIKEKNVKGYIKWLMYWIIYALFASVESVTDLFVAWIPFYYEVKILVLLWLVSPVSRGSIRFYISCLHPLLTKRENEVDAFLSHFKDLLYLTVVKLFGYIFGILRSSLSAGHALILDQIKQKYRLYEISDNLNVNNEVNTETTNESSTQKTTEEQDNSESLQTSEVTNEQDVTLTPATTEPIERTAQATVTSTGRSSTSPSSSVLDSRSFSSDRTKSPVTGASFYDRYTRLSYGTTSSYTSSSSRSSPSQTSALYDRLSRPTTSSLSRYSSSTYSPKTSTYSSRYSKN